MTTYTESCSRSIAGHPAGALDILTQIFRQWVKNQQFKFRVALERRQLLEMSDEMLKDIGISRAQAEAEALRSDLPTSRGC
jgi:uncharacterized protein YjiS (DUF1127 family)